MKNYTMEEINDELHVLQRSFTKVQLLNCQGSKPTCHSFSEQACSTCTNKKVLFDGLTRCHIQCIDSQLFVVISRFISLHHQPLILELLAPFDQSYVIMHDEEQASRFMEAFYD